jgi:hypothetical protein
VFFFLFLFFFVQDLVLSSSTDVKKLSKPTSQLLSAHLKSDRQHRGQMQQTPGDTIPVKIMMLMLMFIIIFEKNSYCYRLLYFIATNIQA